MAKKRKMAAMLLLMFCFVSVGVLATPHSVYAKKINSMKEAEKLARKKVKNAKQYIIYRSTQKDSGYVKVKALKKNKLSYTDKKVKKGKTYYFTSP